jgi:hypothetical protein
MAEKELMVKYRGHGDKKITAISPTILVKIKEVSN